MEIIQNVTMCSFNDAKKLAQNYSFYAPCGSPLAIHGNQNNMYYSTVHKNYVCVLPMLCILHLKELNAA